MNLRKPIKKEEPKKADKDFEGTSKKDDAPTDQSTQQTQQGSPAEQDAPPPPVKKYIVLNKDGLTTNMDPPQDYGEKKPKGHIVIPSYQEIDTKPQWSIDPKVMSDALASAIDAQKVHTQESAMLKAQCADKLCDLSS